MAAACSVLSSDCWELIFNRVENLEAISLVCKDFLSISNNVRRDLKVYSSSITLLIQLLKRFRYLKRIDFSEFYGDINPALLEVARSGLNLESLNISERDKSWVESCLKELGSNMKSLKTLECSWIKMNDSDLIAIASSLPWLEEIDISNCSSEDITDDGIEMLTKRLLNLQKIDISGNHELTGRSLIALSSNCPLLKKIKVRRCDRDINQTCLGHLFRHSTNLVSISISRFRPSSSPSGFTIENSVAFANNLCELNFRSQLITDRILCAIRDAHLPLKKFSLDTCKGWSILGLSALLQAHQSLVKLKIGKAKFLNDKDMSGLFRYLRNLTYINLDLCGSLTGLTFFNLLKSCPVLVKISMRRTCLGEENSDLVTNDRIQELRLPNHYSLTDESLKKIGLSCPNLQLLDVRTCGNITNDGIGEVLKCCNKIKHLQVYIYGGTKIFATNLELLESGIEVLQVSRVEDEEMEMIAKKCPRLRKLDVSLSYDLTNKGVMTVVENCVKLREINLIGCEKVSADIIPLMVSTRPSLRKIFPPSKYFPSEQQKNLYVDEIHDNLIYVV